LGDDVSKAGPLSRYEALVRRGEISADPAQAEAARWLQSLHDELASYRPGGGGLLSFLRKAPQPRGLYICGDVGRGKSMLMDLFFDTAPVAKKRRVHFLNFMEEVHGAIKAWRALSDEQKRARLRDLKLKGGDDPIPPVAKDIADGAILLCFDEFQVEDVADAMILGRIFEALFSFGVIVVATSNRPPHELYLDGLNRQLFLPTIAMLQSKMDIYQLDAAGDYRVDRAKGMDVYFCPLGTETDNKMEAAWEAVTGSAESGPCDIKVKGRRLRLAACAGGAMRDSFVNLCAKAHGPADYLAIAERFHTVFIDHIPELDSSKRNEAKRFVTLIDALYERQVKLFASAAVGPDKIYPSGDGSFQFARTISRLLEMQAQDYLAQPHRTGTVQTEMN
jgi:cell division protein ZapE